MTRHIALYARVSTNRQDTANQEPDLERWAALHAPGTPVEWYRDSLSGKTMNRPGWHDLETALIKSEVTSIVVWRLDRLGRTASGLTKLFDQLQKMDVNLVSVKESLDFSTPAGRLMANVVASMAQYENEIRSENIRAGVARAKAAGKRWGGSKPGRRYRVTDGKVSVILDMEAKGATITSIARTVGLSRDWVYEMLRRHTDPAGWEENL